MGTSAVTMGFSAILSVYNADFEIYRNIHQRFIISFFSKEPYLNGVGLSR